MMAAQESQGSHRDRSLASALQQSQAERIAADRSDLNSSSISPLPPSDSESLLVHGQQSITTAGAAPSSLDSLPAPPEEHYKTELRQVLLWLRTQKSRLDVPDRIEFHLPIEQFQKFQDLVQSGEFADGKLKYDYSSDHETLTLRMAGDRHEHVVSYLFGRLILFIDQAKRHPEPSIAEFASNLSATGSARVLYRSRYDRRETQRRPDLTITNPENPNYPILVGEVAVSQTTQALENLAREYVELSDGQIRTVICIDLDYPMANGVVRVSVWRAKFGEDGKFESVACDDSVEIRNQDGIKNPHARVGLSLSLGDFALRGEVTNYTGLQSVVMTVSTDELHKEVERAEEYERARKPLQG
ncbi:hypothetical protein CLAIMM_08326 [Cladophialophora immunda]|nr:hypothetical protein CLAIMM_08326 [Cladophialophora immunda]